MVRTERRFCAAMCCALALWAVQGMLAGPALAAYEGAPDVAIFSDHFAVLEEHEKALNAAPVAAPARPSILEFIERPRRTSLPPLPDIHEVTNMTLDQLIARSACPGCLPGPAARATGLPVGVFEGAWRRALEQGWRAGYDEMRAATDRIDPPGITGDAASKAYYLRYIRRIVHGWQVAVVHTLRAQKKITLRQAARYQAVLDRTLPPPGPAPHAPQRIRTGWVSDMEMDALDRRYAPPKLVHRLVDSDERRIEERFLQPTEEAGKDEASVEGNANVIPFARLATGYAYDFLAGDMQALLPADTQLWSRTSGKWTLDTASHRLVVSGGMAWPLGEATKLGTALSWGRSWRDGNSLWQAESYYLSPFLTHALNEHVRLRLFGGAGYRTDRIAKPAYQVEYGGQSLYSGASVEGSWTFGRLKFTPAGQVSMTQIDIAAEDAFGESRTRGRATYRNGFTWEVPKSRYISRLQPFANIMTHWTFDEIERQTGAANALGNVLSGAFEGGFLLKAIDNLVDARLTTGVTDVGGARDANYTVTGQLKFSF